MEATSIPYALLPLAGHAIGLGPWAAAGGTLALIRPVEWLPLAALASGLLAAHGS